MDEVSVVAALIAGFVMTYLTVKYAYARSVRRLIGLASSVVSSDVASVKSRSWEVPIPIIPLTASVSQRDFQLVDASRRRRRRTVIIVLLLLLTGLLHGLTFLTVVEPGSINVPVFVVASLVFAAPGLIAWLLARTVNRGQLSELGLWAGFAGLGAGAAMWISASSLGEVRLRTAAMFAMLGIAVTFLLLVLFSSALRQVQRITRFSSEVSAAMLACIAGALFWGFMPWEGATGVTRAIYCVIPLLFPITMAGIGKLPERGSDAGFANDAPRLLFLRTFGHTRRSNKLLRDVANAWLEVGPIDLLAGPDLAASIITLHKANAWLTGRLRKVFISNINEFTRAAAAQVVRFRDGRYPLREFSCLPSGWRIAMTMLAREANVIIMDLRGFARDNNGCVFEIRTLIAEVPRQRIIFLVDDTTDVAGVQDVMEDASRNAEAHPSWSTGVATLSRLASDDRAGIDGVLVAALDKLQQSQPQLSAWNR